MQKTAPLKDTLKYTVLNNSLHCYTRENWKPTLLVTSHYSTRSTMNKSEQRGTQQIVASAKENFERQNGENEKKRDFRVTKNSGDNLDFRVCRRRCRHRRRRRRRKNWGENEAQRDDFDENEGAEDKSWWFRTPAGLTWIQWNNSFFYRDFRIFCTHYFWKVIHNKKNVVPSLPWLHLGHFSCVDTPILMHQKCRTVRVEPKGPPFPSLPWKALTANASVDKRALFTYTAGIAPA